MGKQLPLVDAGKHTDNQVVNEEKSRNETELRVSKKYATMELKTEVQEIGNQNQVDRFLKTRFCFVNNYII